ncbi:MAG: hypothetical protein EF813_05580 [Methanosarcinales archaeon]|nr:MAG: hypothetical protein EF813_05580 [Methanosarcinales archaeon]
MKGTTKPNRFKLAAAGLLATLLIAAAIAPAIADEDREELTVVNTQEPDSDGEPVLISAEDALLRDAQEYASDMGVSTDEALRRLQLQDSIGELNAEISTNEVATFAGLWIEHTPKYRVVVQFTQDSEETIKPYLEQHTELADIVEVRTANVSLADLR